MARRKRFGSVKRSPEKMIRRALRPGSTWSKAKSVTIKVTVAREAYPSAAGVGLPLQHKGWAGTYVARACVAQKWPVDGRGPMGARRMNQKCATGGGRTPTHALQMALRQLAGKLK